ATCVRLPVVTSHSESVFVEIDEPNVSVETFKNTISKGEGIVLEDDPSTQTYPTPLSAEEKKDVIVGRIRKDLDADNGLNLLVVSDNLVKREAWNTVQITTSLVKNNLV